MQNKTNNTIQAFWVATGSLSSFALGIVSAAILSRYFDKAEYGTYRQILYVYNTLLVIFSAGLPRVFAYFLPRYPLEQGKHIVWKVSKLLFLFGMAFSIVLFVFSGLIAQILKNPELEIGLRYFSPIPMLLLPTLGIEGIFSTYQKTVYIAIYNTITRTFMLLCIVLPVILLQGTYLYAIYGWIAVSVLSLGIAWYFKGIPFKDVAVETANLKYKEIFTYSLPLVVASLAGIAIKSADQFYISRYFGAEVFAEYANGFIQLPFVHMITGATSVVLMPQFSKLIHEKAALTDIKNIWKNALSKSALIIYPVVIFFIFQAKPIITLLYTGAYTNSIIFFQIALVINFFNIIVFSPLLFSLGETKFYSKIQILGAIIAWIGGFLIVSTSQRPELIACLSASIVILLVFLNLFKIAKLLEEKIYKLIPIKIIITILTHSILSFIIIDTLINRFIAVTNVLSLLVLKLLCFYIFLFITSRFIKLDYLSIIKPVFLKFKKLKK